MWVVRWITIEVIMVMGRLRREQMLGEDGLRDDDG